MRVISGKARGTKISTIESNRTRPTLDRVKESLFNIIQNDIKDTIILDLFAGSGALGIEALSRGARKAIFCDNNYEAIRIIKDNLEKTKLIENAIIINKDYTDCINHLSNNSEQFDIVFLDPPYKLDIAINALKLIINNNLLKNDGLIIIETDEKERELEEVQRLLNDNDKENLDKKIIVKDLRKYGRANLIFIKYD